MIAKDAMTILGKWFVRMCHKIQEHRNKKADITDLGGDSEEIIYLEVNCVKWEKNLLKFKGKVT